MMLFSSSRISLLSLYMSYAAYAPMPAAWSAERGGRGGRRKGKGEGRQHARHTQERCAARSLLQSPHARPLSVLAARSRLSPHMPYKSTDRQASRRQTEKAGGRGRTEGERGADLRLLLVVAVLLVLEVAHLRGQGGPAGSAERRGSRGRDHDNPRKHRKNADGRKIRLQSRGCGSKQQKSAPRRQRGS